MTGSARKESAQQILAQSYERERRETDRRIGDDLRQTYEPTVRAPLPSDWLKLIDSLRQRLSLRK